MIVAPTELLNYLDQLKRYHPELLADFLVKEMTKGILNGTISSKVVLHQRLLRETSMEW